VRAGYTQEEVAHLSGIDRSYVSFLERGKASMSFRVVRKMAKVLEQRVSALVRNAE